MVELSEKKKGIEELLEKIPPEKRWAITSKILSRVFIHQGEKTLAPHFGSAEGFYLPALGMEKWVEINIKIFGDGAKILFPMFKDMFNVPVKDAIGATALTWLVAFLQNGPEWEWEYVEKTPERVVNRVSKCVWMERYKELEVASAFTPCDKGGCQAWGEQGLKAINPKLTYKLTKAMPRGDPYCETVIEFKEE